MADIKRYLPDRDEWGYPVMEEWNHGAYVNYEDHIAAIKAAVAAEREACAKLCDDFAANSSNPMNFAENCAEAIRARCRP